MSVKTFATRSAASIALVPVAILMTAATAALGIIDAGASTIVAAAGGVTTMISHMRKVMSTSKRAIARQWE